MITSESDDDEFEETYENVEDSSQPLEKAADDLNEHINKTINSKYNSAYDHVFGISYNPNTKQLLLGPEVIEIQGKNLILNGKQFEGTPGLYNLLFLKDPKHFTKNDNLNYIAMLKLSKVIYLNNDPSQRIKGNSSKKYIEIIKPYFIDKTGKGMNLLTVTNKPYRAIYWDNVNELVDRLALLHASKNAGNNSVHNEIIAIEEELREAGIIY